MNQRCKIKAIYTIAVMILMISLVVGPMINVLAYSPGNINSYNIVSAGYEYDNIGIVKLDGTLYISGASLLIDDKNLYDVNPMKNITGVKSLALGNDIYAYIKNDNSLWMFGSNLCGALGIGSVFDEDSTYTPQKVMDGVKAISVGGSHCAAIKTDGSLWMWGGNYDGQLGTHTQELSEAGAECSSKPIKIMENVKSVALGESHSAAIKTDGSLWMWGDNLYGQLGNGINTWEGLYEPIKIMENVESVYLGHYHSAAIKKDGSLWIWGKNDYAQLGVQTYEYVGTSSDTTISTKPIKIMDNVVTASLGRDHSAAIKKDGSLWMWGSNIELEDKVGDVVYSSKYIEAKGSLKPVHMLDDVQLVALTYRGGVVVKKDGSVCHLSGSKISDVSLADNSLKKDNENPANSLNAQKNTKTSLPAKIKSTSVKNLKGKRVKFIWKKIKKRDGYQIAYATNKKFKKQKKVTVKAKKTSITIKKLKKKKTYYFRVRAYIKVNGKKQYGAWSKIKKVKITK